MDTEPSSRGSGSHGTAGDGSSNGEDVEEDEGEAAERREETEGESKENAARGSAEENVVCVEEELVSVVMGSGH